MDPLFESMFIYDLFGHFSSHVQCVNYLFQSAAKKQYCLLPHPNRLFAEPGPWIVLLLPSTVSQYCFPVPISCLSDRMLEALCKLITVYMFWHNESELPLSKRLNYGFNICSGHSGNIPKSNNWLFNALNFESNKNHNNNINSSYNTGTANRYKLS